MEDTNDERVPTTRRTILAGAGAVGVVAALAACGSGSSGGSPSGSGASGGSLGKTSDIPVGGGKIFDTQNVVVTQPTSGTFKAFSAKCTHQGCQVSSVGDGVIKCPCHGSQFSITDGSVKNGPATAPLPAASVTVQGDSLVLG